MDEDDDKTEENVAVPVRDRERGGGGDTKR